MPASVAFWGQKAVCWDNPNPLKVSGVLLTNAVVIQRRCLLVHGRYIYHLQTILSLTVEENFLYLQRHIQNYRESISG